MSKAISLPFSFDVNGAVASTKDQKKIVQDRVVLVVMTTFNERVMRAAFGTNVRRTAFENISNALTLIQQEVEAAFSNWLSYLYLISVDGKIDPVDGSLNVTINYRYGNSQTPESVTVRTSLLTQSGDLITEVPYGKQQ